MHVCEIYFGITNFILMFHPLYFAMYFHSKNYLIWLQINYFIILLFYWQPDCLIVISEPNI